jgi:alkylated DNA repair dioxygenase AlkB
LLAAVDARPWLPDLKRRVQHYGYKYDYKARAISHSMFVGPLPGFAVELAGRLVAAGVLLEPPDQLIVNEYIPGQGISAHVDCEPCFKDRIVTISLGSACEMDFRALDETGGHVALMLQPRSALLISGPARYLWTHAIRGRKSDHGRARARRVSLTFRNVILAGG